ncbi:hypothetical protein [Thetidibacter halocola]|uniref:hypothetical protein n=1 Tax=Thetidibacter halocola TaxID=2827239 RepID=UPI0020127BC9|nr:hypothetical protein [Thetidibacter halocola]
MRLFAPCLAILLTACTQFPELDAAETPGIARAPYPALLPLDSLLTGPTPRASEEDIAAIEARAARLDAQAGRLATHRASATEEARIALLKRRADELRAID